MGDKDALKPLIKLYPSLLKFGQTLLCKCGEGFFDDLAGFEGVVYAQAQ